LQEGRSGLTALHIAIEQSNEEIANYLLDECPKLSIESKTYAGLTAYQLAAFQHNQMLVSSLMQRGAEAISPPESDSESDYSDDEVIDRYNKFMCVTFSHTTNSFFSSTF
jgi:ankyrin only family protein